MDPTPHWTSQDGASHPLTGRPAVAAIRLVDDFDAKRITFKGREPRTLEELAIAREDYRHRCRLAEIKSVAGKMAQLDAFLPGLAERGISLAHRTIATWDGGKTLRIESGASTSGDNKLHAALLALGFHEIARKPLYRDEYTVTLKHGRALLVSFVITVPQEQQS